MNAYKAEYEIIYNGKNITKDILHFVLSFTYTDKSEGESDEIEILVEDVDGFWSNEWYPQKGDTITARIRDLDSVLECGTFVVDELTGSGGSGGNTVSIKALAAGIDKRVRTSKSYAHENKTLREIANTIAAANGLQVVGTISNVRIARVTQYRQNDLSFLKKLAHEYGYTFSIRDKQIIFTDVFSLEDKEAATQFGPEDIVSWSITDKTAETFSAARITYHNPKKKKTESHETKENKPAYSTVKGDGLQIHLRAENKEQAEIKSKVALYRANSLQQSGSFDIQGNVLVLAGNNTELFGLGIFSGLYYVQTSTHSVTRDGGYSTSAEIKRVALITKERQKRNV